MKEQEITLITKARLDQNFNHELIQTRSKQDFSSIIKRSDWTKMVRVELQPPSEILLEGFILSVAQDDAFKRTRLALPL